MRVGVTGITSDLGRGLVPLLEASSRVERIIGIDVAQPPDGPKTEWRRLDLTRPDVENELAECCAEARLDALFHLAFVNSRVHGAAFSHELEVIGTMHLLAAAQAVRLPRLIIPSLTMLYGAQRGASLHAEHHPLLGTGARFITDRVEVEHAVASFASRNPLTQVVVLRFAPIVGPCSDNPLTRLLRSRFVPTLLGFDPLWQVVHESDAARALLLALTSTATGAFNIVAPEALPFSTLVRLAKVTTAPLPAPLLRSTIRLLEAGGMAAVPVGLLDYLTYACLADSNKAMNSLGFSAYVRASDAMASVLTTTKD